MSAPATVRKKRRRSASRSVARRNDPPKEAKAKLTVARVRQAVQVLYEFADEHPSQGLMPRINDMSNLMEDQMRRAGLPVGVGRRGGPE